MRLHTRLVPLLAALLAPAAAAQTHTLERVLRVGDRARIEITSASELEMIWDGPHARVGGAELNRVEHRYLEECRSAEPERHWREYERSIRTKRKRGEEGGPVRTSLHGRAVLVSGLELRPDGPFEIAEDDADDLRYERLLPALLPPQRVVKRGDEWTISAEAIGEALFGRLVPAANLEGSGARVQLRGVRRDGGEEVATLRVKALAIRTQRSSDFPAIDLQFRGEVKWSLTSGAPLAARLEGPVSFTIAVGEGELEAAGEAVWTYAAELLERRQAASDADRAAGEPPPPGTRALVCELEPAHSYALDDIARCMQCGAELDPRRACAEHGFPLQFCPRDGGRLQPE